MNGWIVAEPPRARDRRPPATRPSALGAMALFGEKYGDVRADGRDRGGLARAVRRHARGHHRRRSGCSTSSPRPRAPRTCAASRRSPARRASSCSASARESCTSSRRCCRVPEDGRAARGRAAAGAARDGAKRAAARPIARLADALVAGADRAGRHAGRGRGGRARPTRRRCSSSPTGAPAARRRRRGARHGRRRPRAPGGELRAGGGRARRQGGRRGERGGRGRRRRRRRPRHDGAGRRPRPREAAGGARRGRGWRSRARSRADAAILALDHGDGALRLRDLGSHRHARHPARVGRAARTRGGASPRSPSWCAEREAERVVVGLPLTLAGEEGAQARAARAFAERLAETAGRARGAARRAPDDAAGRAHRRRRRRGLARGRAPARELPRASGGARVLSERGPAAGAGRSLARRSASARRVEREARRVRPRRRRGDGHYARRSAPEPAAGARPLTGGARPQPWRTWPRAVFAGADRCWSCAWPAVAWFAHLAVPAGQGRRQRAACRSRSRSGSSLGQIARPPATAAAWCPARSSSSCARAWPGSSGDLKPGAYTLSTDMSYAAGARRARRRACRRTWCSITIPEGRIAREIAAAGETGRAEGQLPRARAASSRRPQPAPLRRQARAAASRASCSRPPTS